MWQSVVLCRCLTTRDKGVKCRASLYCCSFDSGSGQSLFSLPLTFRQHGLHTQKSPPLFLSSSIFKALKTTLQFWTLPYSFATLFPFSTILSTVFSSGTHFSPLLCSSSIFFFLFSIKILWVTVKARVFFFFIVFPLR